MVHAPARRIDADIFEPEQIGHARIPFEPVPFSNGEEGLSLREST
jgi:hypothetical protein